MSDKRIIKIAVIAALCIMWWPEIRDFLNPIRKTKDDGDLEIDDLPDVYIVPDSERDDCKQVVYEPLSLVGLHTNDLMPEGVCLTGDSFWDDKPSKTGDQYADDQADDFQSAKLAESDLAAMDNVVLILNNTGEDDIETTVLDTTSDEDTWGALSPVVLSTPLSNIILYEDFGSYDRDLSSVFTDPDGNELTYSATSSDESYITVSISGSTLTITEVDRGSTMPGDEHEDITITVTATNGVYSETDSFNAMIQGVNHGPRFANPLSDLTSARGTQVYQYDSTTRDLSTVFADPDGDPLTYSAVCDTDDVMTISIVGSTLTMLYDGSNLNTLLQTDNPLTVEVTVTASDGRLTASDRFNVEIHNVNDAPVAVNPIADQDYAEFFNESLLSFSNLFNDPDGDAMTYSVESSDETVATVAIDPGTTNLRITEVGDGTTDITITASDGSLSGEFTFTVNIWLVPDLDSPIADQSLAVGFGTETIDISAVFSDPYSGTLTYSVNVVDESVVTAEIVGTDLVITEVGTGTTEIILYANNGYGSTNDRFDVTVS